MAAVGKLLFLLFLALIGFLLIKGLKKAPGARRDGGTKGRERAVEKMVACAHCGVNLPEGESVQAGGRHYCSEEHRRLSD
jgi:uncharacterized protein